MKKRSIGEVAFDCFNVLFMLLIIVVTLYPIWYVAVASLSNSDALMAHQGILLKPLQFSTAAYRMVAKNPNIITGYANTIMIVVLGTLASVVTTSVGAYVLSRKQFPFKKLLAIMVVVSMYFGGGLIPTFIVLTKWLHLGDNRLVLILPSLIVTFNLIVLRTGFEAVPASLEESARIDGANDWQILFKVVVPSALPTLAVIILYYAVTYWNAWFNATIYIDTTSKLPLQVILREILISNSTDSMMIGESGNTESIGESIKYATIMVATLPVLCVYPFVQKYFVKGTMVGAVKG